MTTPNSTYLQNMRKAIIDNEILTEEVVDFYRDLFLLQEEAMADFSTDQAVPSNIDMSRFPVLRPEFNLEDIKRTRLTSLTTSISHLLSNNEINAEELIKKLHNEPDAWTNISNLLLKHDFSALNQIALTSKIGPDEFLFLIINTLRPYIIHLRTIAMKDINTDEWIDKHCPFCGYIPDMAKIITSRENRRYLHCPLCEQEWQYKRLGCTICDNEDIEKLGYYDYSDKPIYRFDYCTECRGYIKTLRVPKEHDESRYNLTVENLATSFLDASAIDMGYMRP